jgi:hypothetical protein
VRSTLIAHYAWNHLRFMTSFSSYANVATRYVVFADTESGQMKMAYAQLFVIYIQRTRQILKHRLRRK